MQNQLPFGIIPSDFWNKVENPNYLKRVLYSDTDSIYIHLDEYPKTPKEASEIAVKNGLTRPKRGR